MAQEFNKRRFGGYILPQSSRVRHLRLERLESRLNLFISAHFAGGTLTFLGDEAPNFLREIRGVGPPMAATVWYKSDGWDFDTGVLAASVKRISIVTFQGEDWVTLSDSFGNMPLLEWLTVELGDDSDHCFGPVPGEVIHPSDPASESDVYNISIFGGSGSDTINGGDDPEYINSGPDGDGYIQGFGGNDWIYGDGGDEVQLSGGFGDDHIFGGDGFDTIHGRSGADYLYGEIDGAFASENECGDYIYGGEGTDYIWGGIGDDDIFGEGNKDVLYGEGGNDTISGGEDVDEIFGGAGADTLAGGLGDDYLYSNTNPTNIDQPYMGVGPNPTWPDMRGTGQQDCDLEDGHPDMDLLCLPFGAMDDFYSTSANPGDLPLDVPAGSGVLSNDYFADVAQYVLDSGPSHGTLSLNSNGAFVYTPVTGYNGIDTFQYQAIQTGTGRITEPATVTIEVMSGQSGGGLTLSEPPKVDCGCAGKRAASLAREALLTMSQAALDQWQQAGVSDAQTTNVVASLTWEIADLPGSLLGQHLGGGRIVIDINAAGYGWFIDATPQFSEEFARRVSRSQREATAGSAAEGKADLLSVLVHEIGHAFGLEHGHGDATNVMADTIGLGTRRNPTVWDAAIVEYLYWSSQRRR